jgi:hypothetical protein
VTARPIARPTLRGAVSAALVVAWLTSPANGEPLARQRVVLADPDLELRHAMEQALAPWQLQVLVEGPAPSDAAAAGQRAALDIARFVVWRDGDQLVVFDRERSASERRTLQTGTLDPPAAAAAALSIKTMMRLPPPPPPPDDTAAAGLARAPNSAIRIQAGIVGRIARGDTTATSARFGGAVAIQPWPSTSWRFGLAGDGGTSISVNRASFKGTWGEWSALAIASWTYAHHDWQLEPNAGLGVRRSVLDGAEMGSARRDTATAATARAGIWVRWGHPGWSVGASAAFDRTFGAPTYTKTATPAEVFQVPGLAAELGGVIALDL